MRRHSLQAIAEIIIFAIINDQTCPAMARDAASQLPHNWFSRRTIFSDAAFCHLLMVIGDLPTCKFWRSECRPVNKAERAMRGSDKPVPPCPLPPNGLVNRQRIEKFIGH